MLMFKNQNKRTLISQNKRCMEVWSLKTTFGEVQNRLQKFDRQRGWDKDPHEVNFICLTTELGELSREIVNVWIETGKLIRSGMDYTNAREKVLMEQKSRIADEIADCVIFLLKVANRLGIDVGEAVKFKIKENEKRIWDAERLPAGSPFDKH